MKCKLHSFIVLFALIILGSPAFAQKWTIEVTGTILSKGKSLTGAKASIYADSNLIMAVTSVNGTFDFFLEPDNDYTLTFSKPGFVPAYILFSTKNVPEKRAKQGFSAYNIVALLSPKVSGTQAELAVTYPQAVVKYDSAFEGGDFRYNKDYAKSMKPFLKVVNREVKEAQAVDDQQKDDDLKKAKADESKVVIYSSATILLLVMIFVAVSIRNYRTRQALMNELQQKKDAEDNKLGMHI